MSQKAARRNASNPSIHRANRDLSAPTPSVADRLSLVTQEYFSVSATQPAFSRRRVFESRAARGPASCAESSSAFRSVTQQQALSGIPEPLPRLYWNSESHIGQLKSAPAWLSVA